MVYLVIVLALVICLVIFFYFKKNNEANELKNKYKDIIDVEKAVNDRNKELNNLKISVDNLQNDFNKQKDQLNQDFISKRNIYETLLKEISILEENLEDISYGLYKPHYNYETSEEYKKKLEQIYNSQKIIIKEEKATYCSTEWTVGNSKAEGKKMTKQNSKLMLRAFNGECDSAIAKVSWNNITNMEARINKAYEAINKLGESNRIIITKEYFNLKIEELRLEFELQEKLYQEKEEQKRIKEQMREEERAQKELAKAQKEAEDEEKRYQKALEKARQDVENATGQELEKLNAKIQELENNLAQTHEQSERALSMAQQTKSGHVYIVSNIGSFGDDIYKIGMTRRLEPLDRVKELSDASVPFEFDVHAMIFSQNAPELENNLHKKFEQARLNLVNMRKEFFNVSLDEIEKEVNRLGLDLHLTKIAKAREYRETLSIKETRNNKNTDHISSTIEKELEKFPASL